MVGTVMVVMAVVGKVAAKLVDPFLKLIGIPITRVFKWESNLKNLKEKAEKLAEERELGLQFTEDADRRGEEVALNVKNWLTGAEKCKREIEELVDDEDKAKKKCFAGLCPNPRARCQISKKVEKFMDAVAPLLDEAARFKFPVSYRPPPKVVSTAPVEGFEQFDSRRPTLNRVMEALRSASVEKIGIHGLPGVGKTMLAKEVARQAKEAQLFDVFVMASVKKNPDLKRIQGEMADKLCLQLHGETEFGRANQLKAYLKKQKRVLVILDDIWTRLDLDEVGIPSFDKKNEACSTGEEQMQCKILLISRDLDVLSRKMATHVNIQVGTLQDEEAWTLLKKIVSDEVENSELLLTATEIAKKCAGLPLAVEAVAKALKGKGAHVWRDALRQLKRPSQDSFTGIPADVYLPIELSYNYLERKELQQTFLLCCLLGHNFSIGDLLTYGFGLDLFPNVKTTGEARDRVLTLVSDLKSSSLLLDGPTESRFDMHDIVHDVAISIASRDHHVLSVIDDYILKEWSDREALQGFKWINLDHANISELPGELECPQLTLFCLNSKAPPIKIPENFFRGMPRLRVVDFTDMCFSSLPSSICLLQNLHTLHVNHSVLEDIAIIGKLISLEVLSLSGSDIEEVPTEIGQLTQLKLLDLSNCTKLEMIRPHVLESLSRLEELNLRNSFDQWDVGEGENQRNASLAELKDLHNLAALDVHVCDFQQIPRDLFFERLKRYKIFIGDVWNRCDCYFKSSKILQLELNTSISYGHSIGMLLKKTEELHLEALKGFRNVVYELEAAGFQELKYLHVKNAPEVQHIVNSVECVFPFLEELFLQNLSNLVKICHGRFGATSFSRLSIITVKFCNQLKNLFPFSVARRILQLKEIRVTECSNMTEIVDEELQQVLEITDASENFELVQLRSLQLQYLPKFIRLCHGNEETSGSSSNSAPLFHEKIVFPNLEELLLSHINIKSIWGSQVSIASSCIQRLTKLIIEACDHLEHLLSSSMAKSLVQLRCLEIKKCKEIREIIEPENAEEMKDLISFPMLEILKIEHLEKHTGFCSGNCSVEFPALKRLFIENCPELKGFTFNHTSKDMAGGLEPLFNEKVSFPNLEVLCIKGLELRIIWHHQLPANSFSKLKSLSIGSCNKLSTVFPSDILKRLCTSLEELTIYGCCDVEEIFELGELKADELYDVTDTQLRHVHLCRLPRLKQVCTRDPRGVLTFRKLQSIKAHNCPILQNLFPTSVAMELQQLERLELAHCGIEEVVAFGEGDEAVPTFVFSHLSTLDMRVLPRIRYFYPRKHVKEWPMLKKFRAVNCGGGNQFKGESLGELPVGLPLFSIEKVIPRLEKLSLTSNDIAMICNRQFPEYIFSNVKSLEVQCILDDSAPISFLERFCNLQKLQIACSDIKKLFPPVASIDCPEIDVGRHLRITQLKLNGLSNLKYICKEGPESDLLLQNVKSLKVLDCYSLISLSESAAVFRNLTTLLVVGCQGLRKLFSFTTAQSLVQLQSITVENCHFLTEVVGGKGDGLEDVIVFNKLQVLELKCLTRLTSFCSANFTFKFPLLEQLTAINCPNFETFCQGHLKTPMLQRIQFGQESKVGPPVAAELNSTINQLYREKVGYAGLQYLELSEFPQLMEIWNKNPQQFLDFRQLCFLIICNCGNLRYLLTPSMALSLVVLQGLQVQNCKKIEQIITEGAMEESQNKMIFPLLQSIILQSCFNLTSFCLGSYGLEFPSLLRMEINDCPKMVTFASTFSTVQLKEAVDGGSKERIGTEDTDSSTKPFFSDQIEFSSCLRLGLSSMYMQQIFNKQLSATSSVIQSVGYLFLDGCCNLEYIFTSSVIKSLVQLKYLSVCNCEMMKEVIVTEGLAEEEMILFPNLEILGLEGLPKLTRFCHRNYCVFPSLAKLDILKCPLLETFISSPTIGDTSHMTTSKRIKNASKSALFDAKVAFPSLEELRIIGLENLRIIWQHQPPADSFCKLKSLCIESCGKLFTIFPSDILQTFCKSLEVLIVATCGSVEEIFGLGELSIEQSRGVLNTQLRCVNLSHLPRLRHVWTKDPRGVFTFWNLQFLRAARCPNLQNIFPASVAMGLQQLEMLILDCCGIEEVVAFGGEEGVPRFVFSLLSRLHLWYLRRLKCFYPGKHVTEWPMLKIFRGYHIEGNKETNVKSLGAFPVQLPLFTVEKVIPRLEKLSLTSNDIAMICNRQFPENLFSNVKVLRVLCYHDKSPVFPFFFIERFFNLERLFIGCSYFKELFPSVASIDCQEKVMGWHLRIRKLKLDTLPNLKHIWSKGSASDLLVQNVESLKVLGCGRLISLSESTASFRSLTALLVERCQGLRILFSLATAQSLVQLQRLTVENCHFLTEIVGGKGDGLEDVIVFRRLEVLKLKCLTRLTSFCSANFTFKFPLLEEVMVVQCPNFETFCNGVVSTPSLLRIQFTQQDNMGRPVVQLNDTVNQLFKEKVGYTGLQYLMLSDFPQLVEIWNKNPQEILDFRQLRVLEICNCGDLRFLLTPFMVSSLISLKEMKVKNCEMMEQIITEEEATEVDEKEIIFPLIETINLESCPNLTSFCMGKCKLECPSLSRMNILDCPKMVTFASTFSTVQVKEVTEGGSAEKNGKEAIDILTAPLFGDQVAFPSLEELRIIGLDSLRIIWQHQPPTDSFCKLKSLCIESCGKLLTIFPSDKLQTFCKSLEELNVATCGSLEEIFGLGELSGEESHGVLNTQLRHLCLSHLPRLRHVWTKDPQGVFSFCNLQSVRVVHCPNLQNMFPASVAMEFQQLEKLILVSCGIEEVVAFRGEEAVPRFVFPSLSTLGLWSLPRLKYFYAGRHVTEWPMLKKFLGYHIEGITETNVESLGAFPVQLPLFTAEKVIPRLEKLCLTSNDIAMICNHQFPENLFSNVKALRVLCYHDESMVFPFFFIERFFNLERLFIGCSYFKELFSSVASIDCQEKVVGWLLRIRKLKLDKLPNLKYIWSKGSASDLLVQNVESLKVLRCDRLISLSESTASFRSLTALLVERCQGLRILFSLATAQGLVQLQSITVENCHFLTEIVGGEGDGLEDVIVFRKLEVLKLKCLTRLTSFCSANFTFKFPLLEEVMVVQCPNFETFCNGVVSTPSLLRIQLTQQDNIGRPVVQLNDTVNQLFKEKVGYTGLQYLMLSDIPQLVEIWNKNPQEILDFRQLRVLEICNCGDLRFLLTPFLVSSLISLKEMKVKNCEMMEQIITEEEATEADEKEIIFPLIETINLESCPNLTSFCMGNYKLECPSLSRMNLLDCPKMVTFASTFSTVQAKEAAEGGSAEKNGKDAIDLPAAHFFSDQVEFSSILELTLSSMNMQQIFQKQLSTMSSIARSVKRLILKGCGKLTYLFTSSTINSLAQLKLLEIHDCMMMKEVIVTEGLAEEESLLLVKLETLALEGLPKLTRFCSGNYFEFPFLTNLHIIKCPLLETFISNSNAGETSHMTESKIVESTFTLPLFDAKVGFPRLQHLVLKDMESLNMIWDNQLDAESFHKLDQLLVKSCGKLLNIFSVTMLGRLQNLEKLKIKNCVSLEKIFEPQGLNASESQALKIAQSTSFGAAPNFVFPKVTLLLLKGLPNLKSICPGICFTEWPSLKELVVFGCNQVLILASELMRHQRTTGANQLEIQNQCPLFWASQATFPSLEKLIVERNDSIKEIWHADDPKDGIVFSELKSLQLKVLPKLTSFCSGNRNFEFPSLEDAIVMQCPNILTLSGGEVSAPKLRKVKLTEVEDA